tara:strand:+ start:2908 stop:3258 length:351 start_codon:yes stop_codon:yes gene_type:complete
MSNSKLGFKVLGRKIVIENPLSRPGSGIQLTPQAEQEYMRANYEKLSKVKVVAVGDGINHIKEGDVIGFTKRGKGDYEVITIGGEKGIIGGVIQEEETPAKEYLVYNEMDILVVYE